MWFTRVRNMELYGPNYCQCKTVNNLSPHPQYYILPVLFIQQIFDGIYCHFWLVVGANMNLLCMYTLSELHSAI